MGHDLYRKPESKYRDHSFEKIYDPKVLPDEIIEEISCEVMIKGKKEKIEFALPIKRTAHYTGFDVLMGI